MTASPRILVLNGPNLNMLGAREPHIYGGADYAALQALIQEAAADAGARADEKQSNSEGELVTLIQQAPDAHDAIVLNAGAYTHTSIAIRDALLAAGLPFAEVHISNVYKREPFRHASYLSDIAECVICGAGIAGYRFAIEFLARRAPYSSSSA